MNSSATTAEAQFQSQIIPAASDSLSSLQTLEQAGSSYWIYLIVVGVIVLIWMTMRKGKSGGNRKEIGILGERGSGKTQLLIGFSKGKQIETVPSIENNTCQIELGSRRYDMTDFIGDNISKQTVLAQISRFHTLVHVIDGTDSKKLGDAALFIYKVLICKKFQAQPCNYILFLNKADLSSFHGAQRLVKRIEDQIQTIKVTRKNGSDENQTQDDYLRKEKSRIDLNKEGIEVVIGSAKENRKALVEKLEEICG